MPNEQDENMRRMAHAHLSMLYQAATGQTAEPLERIERRYTQLVTYLEKGTLAADADDQAFAARLRALLSTQPVETELAAAG